MNPEILNQYIKLNEEFDKICRHICSKLKDYEPMFDRVNSDSKFNYCKGWCGEDYVEVFLEEYGSYGYYHGGDYQFPATLLTATDAEIDEFVHGKIMEQMKREEMEKFKKEQAQNEKDLAEYSRLKKKFENNEKEAK